MNITDIQTIIITVVASVGGISAIVGGLAYWLSKLWADRIIEADNARHARDLEQLKTQYALEIERQKSSLELLTAQFQRFSEVQFEHYSELWSKLLDVKNSADELWQEANHDNLLSFVSALANAQQAVDRASLYLEEEHYHQLKQLLTAFQNYELGKRRLIDIRTMLDFHQAVELEINTSGTGRLVIIEEQIRRNRSHKQQYENLLLEVGSSLKTKLYLPPHAFPANTRELQ